MALGAITYTSVTWTTGDTITETKLDNMVANDQAYDSHAAQGILLNNDVGYYQKESGGTNRPVANIDASDNLDLGDSNLTALHAEVPFDNVPEINVGSFTPPVATGNNAVTGVGFKPKLVQLRWLYNGGACANGSGTMDDSGNEWARASTSRAIATNNVADDSVSTTSGCIYGITMDAAGATSVNILASYVSMDSDGFTINFSTTSTTYDIGYIAIG